MTDTELREAVARALAKHDRIEICSDASYALSSYGPKADAALSLMQPEIDRRVAEEKAKLLAGLREPTSEMVRRLNAACDTPDVQMAWVFPYIATLLAEAFQQENSDER